MNFKPTFVTFFFLIIAISYIDAGPLAYGVCQTGCNALAVACYSAGGFVFGTVTAGAGVPAAILACNAGLGTYAGPLAYGICQAGCNVVAAACYAAAGFTFGTVTVGLGVPTAILGCNSALGTCMTACILAGFAPTP